MEAMSSIGDYAFNIDPESVSWSYSVLSTDKPTVGGKVVQVLGIQYSDISVTGSFGSRRMSSGEMVGGWTEQAEFLEFIKRSARSYVQDPTEEPIRFVYPQMGWDFRVRLKNYVTGDGGPRSIRVRADIGNPKWRLTLHVVRDNAQLKEKAMDKYIERLANGMGWKATVFQGPFSESDVYANIANTIRPGETTEQWLARIYAEGQGIFQEGTAASSVLPTNFVGIAGSDPTIMGQALIPASTVKEKYKARSGVSPTVPLLGIPIDDVIDAYYRIGGAEQVRPDFAFAQAIQETGNFVADRANIIRYNFAGVASYNGAAHGQTFTSVDQGVLAHIHLLKRFSEGNGVPLAIGSDASPTAGATAKKWSELAGTWAVPGTGYWEAIKTLYREIGGTIQ